MSTEFPYVNIVTPVHNGGKYLKLPLRRLINTIR
jgi:hypothetical protein